jgi:hypothetical protein
MYVHYGTASVLARRDNMGFAIAPALIIFLVIVGGGALVCIGCAIYGFYSDDFNDNGWRNRTPEQDAYMKEVRERNWSKLPRMAGRNVYRPSHQNLAHAPVSHR